MLEKKNTVTQSCFFLLCFFYIYICIITCNDYTCLYKGFWVFFPANGQKTAEFPDEMCM